jgi:hypothetical protein
MDCPRCRQKVHVEDVDLANVVAKCAGCKNLFAFDQWPQLSPGRLPAWLTKAPGDRVNIDTGGKRVSIVFLTPASAMMLPFALIWNIFSWILVFVVWSDITNLVQVPVLLFFPAIGIWLAYVCLAGLCNKTMLCAEEQNLVVRHTLYSLLTTGPRLPKRSC